MLTDTDIIYRVNEADQICFTNRQYDEFALSNDGNAARSTTVLHRSLWDFITERTTQHLYRKVMDRVRSGRFIQFTFRCDSPACRRLMEMDVVSIEGGAVEFRTRALSEESRPPQRVLQHQVGSPEVPLRMCGWCGSVDVSGDWVELVEATRRLRLFEHASPPTITHGICETCLMKMEQTLADLPSSPDLVAGSD
jgi:hypothetical protein